MINMHDTAFRNIHFKLPYIRPVKHSHYSTDYYWSHVAVQFPDIDNLTSSAILHTSLHLQNSQSGRSLT